MATTYEAIATYTVSGSSTTTITFSSIPQTYTDLVLIFNGSIISSLQNIALTINNDTATNYSNTWMQGNGTAVQYGRDTNISIFNGGAISSTTSVATYNINNYSNTTTYKTVLHQMNNVAYCANVSVALWRSTSAINTLTLSNTTYASGTTATLYGIKAA